MHRTDPKDERDLEILRRTALGEGIGEIAREMKLTYDTVKAVIYADRREFPDDPPRIVQ